MERSSKTSFCTKSDGALLPNKLSFGPASIWEHPKNVKLRLKQFHMTDMGKSSSRKLRRAIYYTLYRMDPQKRTRKIVFAQTSNKSEKCGEKTPIYSPLTPDQPPIKGSLYLRELVRTHVILAPGACLGGAELQSVDQIPWIRGIRGNRGWVHFCAL